MPMPEIFAVILALQLLWTVGLTIYTLSRRPGEEAGRTAADAQAAVAALAARVHSIEADVRHMPEPDTVHSLRAEMAAVRATLAGVQENVTATKASVALIEGYLRHKGGNA